MSLSIAGMSWVTPLGSDVDEVWQRLVAGETAPVEILENEQNGALYSVRRVPANTPFPSHPRLRRASAISRFAAAAGLAALPKGKPFQIDRIAVVFAISNGGVIYTRRFYSEIVKSGAQAASPLLFPETVFNAPASHLAAILGIDGASYTIVGDGAVGILALKLAEDLLASENLDLCLVVGAEEIDPLVCEAYRQWRFLQNPKRPESGRGMILSEGAGAVLLERPERESVSPAATIEKIIPGKNFYCRSEVVARLGSVAARLENGIGFGVGSANGTFIDRAERAAVGNELPLYSPKIALGESVGASVFWQLIVAAQALKSGMLPGTLKLPAASRAFVLACGLNQQTGGLTLRLSR
jgi:3-oxoacyl-(acyl-carrier-protein) synthase